MKKRDALLSGFFAIAAIISTVAILATVYQRPTESTQPDYVLRMGIEEIKNKLQKINPIRYSESNLRGLSRAELEKLLEGYNSN